MAEEAVRGSAFGLLAALQSLGNFATSAIAGILWTTVSPTVAFLWLAGWMAVACIAFVATPAVDGAERGAREGGSPPSGP